MKYFLSILLFSVISINAYSQFSIPSKVKKAFKAQYPEATDVNWINKGDRVKEWRAMYQLNGVLHTSWYDHKGNWEVTKIKIDQAEIPEAVLKTIEEDYYGYDIMITARFERPDQNGFEVWLDNGREGFDVEFSKEGKVLLRTLTSNGYQPIDDNGHFIKK